MIIGDAGAVTELWDAARGELPPVREDRPTSRSMRSTSRRLPGDRLRAATHADLDRLVPACAAAHQLELDLDPLARDPDAFRWRTRRRSTMAAPGSGSRTTDLFKAEASAWTPSAVQIQQVWVDPEVRGRGYGARGMRDLVRLLLETTRRQALRPGRERPAIATYEAIGMQHVLAYRSVIF